MKLLKNYSTKDCVATSNSTIITKLQFLCDILSTIFLCCTGHEKVHTICAVQLITLKEVSPCIRVYEEAA
jgi:hypothetical protein